MAATGNLGEADTLMFAVIVPVICIPKSAPKALPGRDVLVIAGNLPGVDLSVNHLETSLAAPRIRHDECWCVQNGTSMRLRWAGKRLAVQNRSQQL